MNTEIVWTPRKRPSKKMKGHDIRRTGDRVVSAWKHRVYIECECGKVMSAAGTDFAQVYYAYRRHLRDQSIEN